MSSTRRLMSRDLSVDQGTLAVTLARYFWHLGHMVGVPYTFLALGLFGVRPVVEQRFISPKVGKRFYHRSPVFQ